MQTTEDEHEDAEEEKNEARINYAQGSRRKTGGQANGEAVVKGGEDQERMRGERAYQSKAQRRGAPMLRTPRQLSPPRLSQSCSKEGLFLSSGENPQNERRSLVINNNLQICMHRLKKVLFLEDLEDTGARLKDVMQACTEETSS
jgi:hypothetical protein